MVTIYAIFLLVLNMYTCRYYGTLGSGIVTKHIVRLPHTVPVIPKAHTYIGYSFLASDPRDSTLHSTYIAGECLRRHLTHTSMCKVRLW